MVSRRSVLAGAGGVLVAGASLGAADAWSTETGQVYQQSVAVTRAVDGSTSRFDVLSLSYSTDSDVVWGTVVEDFERAYRPPARVVVDQTLHDRLDSRFETVDYVLGFEDEARLSGRFSRADFNRVGIGDRAQVRSNEWLDTRPPRRIRDVTPRSPPVSRTNIRRVSLDAINPAGNNL